MSKLVERFINYVKFDTKSDENSATCPSTEKQLKLAVFLKDEMIGLGLEDVTLDENGYLMGTLPANTDKDIPTFGFVAHMDTAPAFSGKDIKPKFVDYNGGDIVLNEEKNIILSPNDFKELDSYIGETLITTDGTTLLGADDKAGIAEILTAMEYLMDHPEIKHGKIRIGFTPDEEIGRGVDFINLEKVDADFAYTLDGGFPYEVNYENFNAHSAKVTFKGVSIHPGYAKDKMVNAIRYISKFIDMLPKTWSPERTENREPFIHPLDIRGGAEEASVVMILRSFDPNDIDIEKDIINKIVDVLKTEEPKLQVKVEFTESYLNMYAIMKDKMDVFEYVKKAIEDLGAEAQVEPIRGGTDGSRLSFMNLPCPNIFAGGVNFHSQKEWVALENIGLASAVAIKIVENID